MASTRPRSRSPAPARRDEPVDADPARALYVYGVVRADRPLRVAAAGIAERCPVGTIEHQGLAAVVSDVPSGAIDPSRANLLAHERVNGEVLRGHTVIPMSFGTVFRSRDDVVELLRSAHETFSGVLEQMKDKIEFGLKVSWDREQAIRAVQQDHGEIRRLAAAIAAQAADFGTRMEYGQRLESALAQRSDEWVAAILQRLQDVCVASRCNPTLGERMIMNAAFLVARRRESAFDRRVQGLGDDFADLTFQYSGPWPPYNFVTIRLQQRATQ